MNNAPAFPRPDTEGAYKDLDFASAFGTRSEIVDGIQRAKRFDVVIAGGGIHGGCVARLAALSGLRTVLLERDDYAQHTSSRSSKMAHGGLRYLEQFDFVQVFEGIKAREDLLEIAPHLVRPHEFAIPVPKHLWWTKFKFKCGLFLYDLMAKHPSLKHRWFPSQNERADIFVQNGHAISGIFVYGDGIMDDCRVVHETILSARQEGAYCLNHASVNLVRDGHDGAVRVTWQDLDSGYNYEVEAGALINCAGPWVAYTGRPGPSRRVAEKLRFSQGTHLLFTVPWQGPALFLPLPDAGRYYFVWPHEGGTMVGTTEREVSSVPPHPIPTTDEVEEILTRLRKDLPLAGLDRGSLYYAFAGVRTLPLRDASKGPTSAISRRHQWSYANGILSLLGGKFTTAQWTAQEGLETLMKLSESKETLAPIRGRKLPGAITTPSEIEPFLKSAQEHALPEKVVYRCVKRYGLLVLRFMEFPEWWKILGERTLSGEVRYHIEVEQAVTLEDLMVRRLGLEHLPGNGLEAVQEIAAELHTIQPEHGTVAEVQAYMKRVAQLREILGIT